MRDRRAACMYAMRERLRQRGARRQSLAGRSRGGYESRRIARPKWSGNDGRFDFLASPPRCSAACGACAAARAIGTPGGSPALVQQIVDLHQRQVYQAAVRCAVARDCPSSCAMRSGRRQIASVTRRETPCCRSARACAPTTLPTAGPRGFRRYRQAPPVDASPARH